MGIFWRQMGFGVTRCFTKHLMVVVSMRPKTSYRTDCNFLANRRQSSQSSSSSISWNGFRSTFASKFSHYFFSLRPSQFFRTKEKIKLDGTRVKLGCEMRCEAGSNIDERIEYRTFSEKTCFQAVGFDYRFLSMQ